MKITYKRTSQKETNKSGATFYWYKTSTGAWVLDPIEIGLALGLTKKAITENYKLLPECFQVGYLHSAGTELFLRRLYKATEGRSRKLWNLIDGNFFAEDPSDKWDVPVLAYKQGTKQILCVDAQMLQHFKVHPAHGATWATEDCITIEDGTVKLRVIPLSKLITLDAQYNEFASLASKLPAAAGNPEYRACIKKALKIKQLKADTEPMDEKATSFKLRKDLNTALEETEKLRNLLHKHGIDPAGRATDSSVALSKSTDKASASLEKQKLSVQKSLQNYISQVHGSLKAQACLLEAASEEMHAANKSWRHAEFLKLFDNDGALSVLRAAQDDLKSKNEDATDLITLERFIDNHMGYKKPLLREIVDNAEMLDKRRDLDRRKN